MINMRVNREVTGEVVARAGFDAKVLADMFATLDWSADDEIPVARRLVRSRTANVLLNLAIRTSSISRNS